MVKSKPGSMYYIDKFGRNYINSGSISLAICVLMLTATIILITKNSHSKTYNRLTLKPYYLVIIYLTLTIL